MCVMLTLIKGLTLNYSQLSPGLLLLGLFSWVVVAWIVEFAIMVLLVEVSSDGVGNSEEVLHMDGVADVSVEVVLEVLEHVHVLADEVISSDSWERESLVEELPSFNLELWKVLGSLLLQGTVDVLNVGPVSWVKSSGEHFHLVLELTDSLVKVNAWSLGLDEGLVSWTGEVNGLGGLGLGGSDGTEQKEKGIFHLKARL